jgi:hypothetical protein
MTLEEIKAMSAAVVAEQLQEYQKYRRGEPPYDYGITPHRQPFTAKELGAIIDRAVELLTEAHNKAGGGLHRTPQDKILAWRKWTHSESGCDMCGLRQIDKAKMEAYLREVQNGRTIPEPILLCDKHNCFNAWLHSTMEDKR